MNFNLERRRATLAVSLCLLALLPAAFAAPTFFAQKQRGRNERARPVAKATPKKATPAKARSATLQEPRPSPNVSSNAAPSQTTKIPPPRAADAALAREITRLIEEGEFAQSRWGISVVSLRDGRVLYARDAARRITPASTYKLFTTAVTLDLLGANYRWRTSVYAPAAPDARGEIKGDLVLYGRGAPDLASRTAKGSPTAHLSNLADELYRRGVRRVRGALVGDESYFRGEALGDGWQWDDVQWYYGAEVSALSVDDNEITLRIASAAKQGEPAEVSLIPATDYIRVVNDMNMVARGERSTVGITRTLSANEVRIWGDFPAGASSYNVRLSVPRPALRAALLFRDALRARGIEVEGEARVRDARAPMSDEFVPESAVELASVMSRPLSEVVRETNKKSLNLQAELLLRTLGKERGAELAPIADPRRAKERNADAAGLAVVRWWLRERAGVETDGLALHDGSGLSRLDLVTPESITKLLAGMAQTPSARLFRDSLPLAGRDGTLQSRLRSAATAQRINAKTGSLTYINSLAGYANTAEGEPLAFSIICNEETARTSSSRLIDAIAVLLASYPDSKP